LEKRVFTYIVLGVLVWAILGTVVAAYYLGQYHTYQSEYNNLANQLTTYNNLVNNLTNQLTINNELANELNSDIEEISAVLEGISLKTKILLGYGNGTKVWYNNTVLPLGSTAFTAIYYVADDINYTDYGGDLGILVVSLNGVTNNSTHGWFYWYLDPEYSTWILPAYSCAKHILHRGDAIAFTYASYMEWPPSPPT
jgi:hypothetical protein